MIEILGHCEFCQKILFSRKCEEFLKNETILMKCKINEEC